MKKYLVIYEKAETGYSAYPSDLPAVAATGPTNGIVKRNIHAAIQSYLDYMHEKKLNLPKSIAQSEMMVFE